MEGPRVVHRKQTRQAIGHMYIDIGVYYKKKPCPRYSDASLRSLLLFPANI